MDADPFKLFNISQQNVHVPPEIIPVGAEAVIHCLKALEPIGLTEIIKPTHNQLEEIAKQMKQL